MNKYIINEDLANADIENIPLDGLDKERIIEENIQCFSLSSDYLLENWYFDDWFTRNFFFTGKMESCWQKQELSMRNFVVESEIFLEHFYIINDEVYYPDYNHEIKNWEFLNFSSIPYPKVIAAAIYHYLKNEKKKNGDLFYKSSLLREILNYLGDPLFHNEVLTILKKDIFSSSIFSFGLEFLNRIKMENEEKKNPVHLVRGSIKEINSKFFSNILLYIGVPEEKVGVLLKNWDSTHDLNEIQLYLEDFLKEKKMNE